MLKNDDRAGSLAYDRFVDADRFVAGRLASLLELYLALVWRYTWSDAEIESGVTSEWRWDIDWRFGPDRP